MRGSPVISLAVISQGICDITGTGDITRHVHFCVWKMARNKCRFFPTFSFRKSFRKLWDMPFRKVIPPFTFTEKRCLKRKSAGSNKRKIQKVRRRQHFGHFVRKFYQKKLRLKTLSTYIRCRRKNAMNFWHIYTYIRGRRMEITTTSMGLRFCVQRQFCTCKKF